MAFNVRRANAEAVLKEAGITSAPVDINAVAQSLGYKILQHPFPTKERGMVMVEGDNKVIGVNSTLSETNQRFTVGHEIGHILGGHEQCNNTFPDEAHRYADPHFQNEKEADAYAAELLMPKTFLEHNMATMGVDILALKTLYQTSEEAMRIRLQELKLVAKYEHIKPVS